MDEQASQIDAPGWDDLDRCPVCGSLNDDDATFCGQCHTRFLPKEPSGTDPVPFDGTTHPVRRNVVQPHPHPALDPGETVDGVGGLFGRWDGKPVWRCRSCFERNPIEVDACERCGTSFQETARRTADELTVMKMNDSARLASGIVGFGARVMMLVAGLFAPVAFVLAVAHHGVRYLLRRMFGR